MKLSVTSFSNDYRNCDVRVGRRNRAGYYKGEIRLRRSIKKQLSKARRADAKLQINHCSEWSEL